VWLAQPLGVGYEQLCRKSTAAMERRSGAQGGEDR
jgi:hypothetical protein